jgi:cytochrome c oxidase assembly protein subunit 15
MPTTQNTAVMTTVPNARVGRWINFFAFIVAFLIVFGGFVRLTRSGLSIVEWNPISGVMPPIGAQAWEDEFAKYQLTPEYLKVNTDMTLGEYQFIFYIEWIHRLIARLAGLAYAIPVFYFLFTKKIPFKEFGIYFVMGMLFIGQAFMGWYMVYSGLIDRPSVSHFRLTIHLLFALSLLGLAQWTALGHKYGFNKKVEDGASALTKWSAPSKWTVAFLGILLIQISYGGFTAGLKAGHVSDTWPLMLGKLIPPNLFSSFINILENPFTIVFIHRWFAFAVLAMAIYLYHVVRRHNYQPDLLKGLQWFIGAVTLQIILGILTILSYVNIVVALLHQAGAIALFALTIYFLHRFRAIDVKQ